MVVRTHLMLVHQDGQVAARAGRLDEPTSASTRAPQHPMPDDLSSDIMARTTLDLDPLVLDELRRRAARTGRSMGTVASELLARELAEPGAERTPPEFHWVSADLGKPSVDIDDKDSLSAIMDTEA
jgi:plasmid stability protein